MPKPPAKASRPGLQRRGQSRAGALRAASLRCANRSLVETPRPRQTQSARRAPIARVDQVLAAAQPLRAKRPDSAAGSGVPADHRAHLPRIGSGRTGNTRPPTRMSPNHSTLNDPANFRMTRWPHDETETGRRDVLATAVGGITVVRCGDTPITPKAEEAALTPDLTPRERRGRLLFDDTRLSQPTGQPRPGCHDAD